MLQLGPPQEPRTDPEDVAVYKEGEPGVPTVPPHLKVGEITATDSKKPLGTIIAKMKEDASELGADVLVFHTEQRQSGTYQVPPLVGSSRPHITNVVRATAIRLTPGR